MTAPTQDQDVVSLLISQHNEVKALFARVKSSTGEQKRDAFQDLVRLLAVHESAEEQVVHPAARHDAGDRVVDARLHEEDEAKHVLSNLYDLGTDNSEFDTKFAEFEQAVLAHATHEEQEEFPQLRRNTDPDKLRRMAGAVRAAEAVSEAAGKHFKKMVSELGGNNAFVVLEGGASRRYGIPVAADDPAAKKQVFDLIEQIGYEPVDAGSLADSRNFQPGTDVYTADLPAEDLRARIGVQPA